MDGDISSLKDVDGKLLVTYGDGTLCLLDGDKQSALWYNTFLKTIVFVAIMALTVL